MSRWSGRWIADRSLRRSGGGRVVIGGSPLKLFRLSAKGAKVLDAALDGTLAKPSESDLDLLGRLVDSGAIHPEPVLDDSPYSQGDVTVVIPVRDNQDRLDELIATIAATSPGVRGIIVVDDGSSVPVTVEGRVGSDGNSAVTLHRREQSGGPGAARNDGLGSVGSALVAFVDVDCRPTIGWLDPLLAQFTNSAVSVAAPRVVAADPGRQLGRSGRNSLSTYERASSPLDLGDEPARVAPGSRVSYVPSAALVARVESLRSIGGFDASMRVGEDVDLVWRLVARGDNVRYVPGAVVGHEIRGSLSAWIGQRFAYGTSAGPLARRHGSLVAPAAMSPWSLAVWVLATAGQPVLAATLGIATTVQLRRKLPGVETGEVIRLALGGHLGAGRQLARSTVRVWWPAAILGSIVSRRIRTASAIAVVWTIAGSGQRSPAGVALSLLDDVSYGAGVWRGCFKERSIRALLPSLNRLRTAKVV